MAITEERMLRLVSAAESLYNVARGVHDVLGSWREAAERGELTATQVIDAAMRFIATTSPSPYEIAIIHVERHHFESNRSRNAYSRRRMAAIRDPNGEGRKQVKRTGYETKPHNPTGQAITPRPVAPPASPLSGLPRTAAELAAFTAEADRQMAADKAELAAKAAHKPKPLPFAPPRAAPMNPYENDGMPEHGPDVTAENLLRAEAEARARANKKGDNSPSNELTTEPTRATIQTSEQGAAQPPQQEPS